MPKQVTLALIVARPGPLRNSLQALMRHKSYQTTRRYINVAQQLNQSVEQLHVPDVLQTADIA